MVSDGREAWQKGRRGVRGDPHKLAVAWEVMPLGKNDSRCIGYRGHVCQSGFATFPADF